MKVRALLANAEREAIISPCGKYRYWLMRRWSPGPTLLFVMLNPSTADADVDDATIRRCVGFAHQHDFGALEVVNLYAWRATKPADLRSAGYQSGPENDLHIASAARAAQRVCVAWGANAAGLSRPAEVLTLLRAAGAAPWCLAITQSGHPQHPLMLASDCKLTPYLHAR